MWIWTLNGRITMEKCDFSLLKLISRIQSRICNTWEILNPENIFGWESNLAQLCLDTIRNHYVKNVFFSKKFQKSRLGLTLNASSPARLDDFITRLCNEISSTWSCVTGGAQNFLIIFFLDQIRGSRSEKGPKTYFFELFLSSPAQGNPVTTKIDREVEYYVTWVNSLVKFYFCFYYSFWLYTLGGFSLTLSEITIVKINRFSKIREKMI